MVAIALGAAWATWQPLRSVHASNDALAYLYTDGRADAARQTAQIAHDRNPLSVDPYFDLSAIEIAGGRPQAAGRALERAVALQPSNPQTWSRLADYELTRLHDPRRALQAARVAIFLDPRSLDNLSNFLVARRQVTVLEQQAQQARQAQHAQQARQARQKARKKKHR